MRHLVILACAVFVLADVRGFGADESVVALRSVRTGTLTYPALDNVDFREGTIECWIRLAFDPATLVPPQEFQGLATLLSVQGEKGGFNIGYSAQKGQAVPSWWCSMSPKPIVYSMGITNILMKPGEWHHIAITWKGQDTASFFDGKPGGTAKQNAFLYQAFGPLGATPLLIGDKWNYNALYVVDDFRISRVARKAEELGFHGELKPDAFTTVLDPFEGDFDPDGKALTKPLIIAAGEGGLPSAQCRFVEGRFGKGLAFYRLPSPPPARP